GGGAAPRPSEDQTVVARPASPPIFPAGVSTPPKANTTEYVCVTVVVRPERSAAVTENVCGPTLDVSIAPPSCVVPAHVSIPDPCAVSAHPYDADAAEPRT